MQRDFYRDMFERSRSGSSGDTLSEDTLYYMSKEYEDYLVGVLLFLFRLEVISSEEYTEELKHLKDLFVNK